MVIPLGYWTLAISKDTLKDELSRLVQILEQAFQQ